MKSPKDSGSLLYMLWFGTFNMPEGGLQVETAHRKKGPDIGKSRSVAETYKRLHGYGFSS